MHSVSVAAGLANTSQDWNPSTLCDPVKKGEGNKEQRNSGFDNFSDCLLRNLMCYNIIDWFSAADEWNVVPWSFSRLLWESADEDD